MSAIITSLTPLRRLQRMSKVCADGLSRRTGATLRDTGIRDEHGLEPVPSFSSPAKSATRANGVNGVSHNSYEDDMTMNIGDSKIQTV